MLSFVFSSGKVTNRKIVWLAIALFLFLFVFFSGPAAAVSVGPTVTYTAPLGHVAYAPSQTIQGHVIDNSGTGLSWPVTVSVDDLKFPGPPDGGPWWDASCGYDPVTGDVTCDGIVVHSNWRQVTDPDTGWTMWTSDTSPLPPGPHTATIHACDNNGTCGDSATATFTIVAPPSLGMSVDRAYWDGIADYMLHKLTVAFNVQNSGTSDFDASLFGHMETGGVTLSSDISAPPGVGHIAAGGSNTVTLKYNLPAGLASFDADLTFQVTDQYGQIFIYDRNQTVSVPVNPPDQASYSLVIDTNGGSCATLPPVAGHWDQSTLTCTVNSDVTVPNNGVLVSGNGITLDGNGHTMMGSAKGAGISLLGSGGVTGFTLKNATIENFNYGMEAVGADNDVIDNVTFSGNVRGLKLYSSNNNVISNSRFIGNTIAGIDVDPSDSNSFTGNGFSGNGTGVIVTGSNFNTFTGNSFRNNGVQAVVSGGSGNDFTGNFWGDYSGAGAYGFSGGQDAQPNLASPGSGRPDLVLSIAAAHAGYEPVRWATFADYESRLLSVDFKVVNAGANTVFVVRITDSAADDVNVSFAGRKPVFLGNIAAAGSALITLTYTVPVGTHSFKATVYATAMDDGGFSRDYPAPSCPPYCQ